jgi:hypothetical protein
MKSLTLFVGREHRKQVLELERQLVSLTENVDRFYKLLGLRNWIFHDDLPVDRITALLPLPVEEAQARFIAIYKDTDQLRFMVRRLNSVEALRIRRRLIRQALDDYHAGRYYSTVLVLLSVCDGFVNDVEIPRRGLHARTPDDMVAWDSVVGHHMGLSNAHATFTKGFYKTSHEEVAELYRNGIVHGMLTNYDNVVVATKAWNRLFAVADWARSRERGKAEPESQPSLLQTVMQIRDLATAKQALEVFQPVSVSASNPEFLKHPAAARAEQFLNALAVRNFGAMVPFVSANISGSSVNKTAGHLRQTFGHLAGRPCSLLQLNWRASGLCEIDFELNQAEGPRPFRMRWLWEDPEGKAVLPPGPAEWRLATTQPLT